MCFEGMRTYSGLAAVQRRYRYMRESGRLPSVQKKYCALR